LRRLRRFIVIGAFGIGIRFLAQGLQPTPTAPKYDSPLLQHLSEALAAGDSGALKNFWAAISGKEPLIEPIDGQQDFRWITFLWRGDSTTRDVSVGLGDIPTPDPSKWRFRRLGNTDVWFKTDRVPRDARFGYLLQVNGGPLQPDPLNDRRFGGRSVVETPDAPLQSWIAQRPNTPPGQLSHEKIHSRILNEERTFGVYVPHGYEARRANTLLVVLDGEAYGTAPSALVPTSRVLDNLIAEARIPPTIAVLVDNMSQAARDRDLKCSENFENFLTNELIPWLRAHYRIPNGASNVVLAGSSDGGLFALCAAVKFPMVFGNVLAQSADLFYDPSPKPSWNPYTRDSGWLISQFVKGPRMPLRFYLEVGTLEAGVVNPVAEHRRLRDVLLAKGYEVTYSEFSGGHDYLTWRNSLGDGLIALLGHHR
jgi:enterochelin esterase-like enzyme